MQTVSNVKLRLQWLELYWKLGSYAAVCKHFGISAFTLRKWLRRYEELGINGLKNKSCRPVTSPYQKRNDHNEHLILTLRKERKLGARRLQTELQRLYSLSFSLSTIHKTLKKHNVGDLFLKRHYRKQTKRYNCKYPGERVQMDVCKIAAGLYQYTAIDDCTRYKVIALYSRRTSANTLDFLNKLRERMPFCIQRSKLIGVENSSLMKFKID